MVASQMCGVRVPAMMLNRSVDACNRSPFSLSWQDPSGLLCDFGFSPGIGEAIPLSFRTGE